MTIFFKVKLAKSSAFGDRHRGDNAHDIIFDAAGIITCDRLGYFALGLRY
jgi:hypothetical protein